MTSPLVDALGWALIHFLWQGAAIALLAAIGFALSANGGPRLRYAILSAALALMALAPVATFLAELAPPRKLASLPATIAMTAGAAVPVAASLPSAPVVPESGSLRWVVALWAAGVLVSALHAVSGWWRAQELRRRDVSPAGAWSVAAHALAARLGLARPVEVSISSRCSGPVTLGWWRPVILLPVSALTALTPGEIEMILAHELAHIARRDYVVNLLQIAVETVLFYHPAVWWVSRRLRIEREHVADDLAVAACGDRVAYARAMAALDAQAAAPAAVLAASGGSLLSRVERLAGVRRAEASAAPAWLGALIVASVIVAGLVAPPQRALAESAKPSTGFLGGLAAAGYGDLSVDQLIALHDHGVDPAWVAAMAAAGLGRLPVEDLIRLHDHGVRPEFVRGLVEAALVSDLEPGTAIQLADRGVDPAELGRIHALGFGPFPAETVATLRDHGVDSASFEVLRAIGPGDDPADEAIQLRDYGVTMDRIRSMKRQGFENLNVTQVLALARGGVI